MIYLGDYKKTKNCKFVSNKNSFKIDITYYIKLFFFKKKYNSQKHPNGTNLKVTTPYISTTSVILNKKNTTFNLNNLRINTMREIDIFTSFTSIFITFIRRKYYLIENRKNILFRSLMLTVF